MSSTDPVSSSSLPPSTPPPHPLLTRESSPGVFSANYSVSSPPPPANGSLSGGGSNFIVAYVVRVETGDLTTYIAQVLNAFATPTLQCHTTFLSPLKWTILNTWIGTIEWLNPYMLSWVTKSLVSLVMLTNQTALYSSHVTLKQGTCNLQIDMPHEQGACRQWLSPIYIILLIFLSFYADWLWYTEPQEVRLSSSDPLFCLSVLRKYSNLCTKSLILPSPVRLVCPRRYVIKYVQFMFRLVVVSHDACIQSYSQDNWQVACLYDEEQWTWTQGQSFQPTGELVWQ